MLQQRGRRTVTQEIKCVLRQRERRLAREKFHVAQGQLSVRQTNNVREIEIAIALFQGRDKFRHLADELKGWAGFGRTDIGGGHQLIRPMWRVPSAVGRNNFKAAALAPLREPLQEFNAAKAEGFAFGSIAAI